MSAPQTLTDLKKSIESLPVFIMLDSLYSKNDKSPIGNNKNAAQKYSQLVDKLQAVFNYIIKTEVVDNPREFPFTTLFSIAEMIIYSNEKVKDISLEVMRPDYEYDYLTCHSLNVAFIACKIGVTKGLPYNEVTETGVAALLHDSGMLKLDPESFFHDRALSQSERELVESHPGRGHAFFQHIENDFPWLLKVILEEHRRENSNGYPVAKGELHLYSKIIGVSDSFEALTHKRSFRKALHPADAMRSIINTKGSYYAKDVLKPLIESMAIYPVGSFIQLNNKRIAQVVEAVSGSPLRPIVQVISDDNSQERVNLSEQMNLYITGLIYDNDYQTRTDQ